MDRSAAFLNKVLSFESVYSRSGEIGPYGGSYPREASMSKSQLGGYDEERVPGACGRCVWDSQTARSILRLFREQLFLLDGRVAARPGGRTSAYEGRRFPVTIRDADPRAFS